MTSLTERSSLRKKIVLYEDYLQLKNAYINLKDKNDKLKEEKQKLEVLLKKYRSNISDYKTSNNTINLLFKKFEMKFKELSDFERKNYKEISMVKNNNFKIINIKKNAKIKSFENLYVSHFKDEIIFIKKINVVKKSNGVNMDEYNNKINKYLEEINKLKDEIKIKEELYKNQNQINENSLIKHSNIEINERVFDSLSISKGIQYNLFSSTKKNDKRNYIVSKVYEYKIMNKIEEEDDISKEKLKIKNLEITSKCCELNIIEKKNNKYKIKNDLIIASKICDLNFINASSIILKETKKDKIYFQISSSKLSILSNVKKINENNLIISSKICEYNILNNNKDKLKFIEIKKEIKGKNIIYKNLYKSSKVNEVTILSKNKLKNKLFENLEISSNKELSIYQNIQKIKNLNKLCISSNISNINILKPKKNPILFSSLKVCELNIMSNSKAEFKNENKIENLNKKELLTKCKICGINFEGLNKNDYIKKINDKLKIESNIIVNQIFTNKSKKIKIKNEITNVERINIPQAKRISFYGLNIFSKSFEIVISRNKYKNQILNTEKIQLNYLVIKKKKK